MNCILCIVHYISDNYAIQLLNSYHYSILYMITIYPSVVIPGTCTCMYFYVPICSNVGGGGEGGLVITCNQRALVVLGSIYKQTCNGIDQKKKHRPTVMSVSAWKRRWILPLSSLIFMIKPVSGSTGRRPLLTNLICLKG